MKVFKFLTSIVFLLFLIANSGTILAEMPEFSEDESIYLIENTSNDIVLNNQGDEIINSGEMNRLMSVLVSLDLIGNKLSDKVIVGEELNDLESVDNLTGFEIDQEVSYQDLLSAILLTGSPDATQVLAYNIGNKIKGENKSDGTDYTAIFLKRMNEKAKDLEMNNTNFTSVLGSEDEENTTSVKDLSILSKELFTNESVKKILSSNKYSIKLPVVSESKDSEEGEEGTKINEKTQKTEVPTIELTNQFLPIFSADINTDVSENTDSEIENSEISEEEIESESEEDLITKDKSESEETKTEATNSVKKSEENKEQEKSKNSTTTKTDTKSSNVNIKAAYIANENTDNATVIFESQANDADIIGCVSGLGVYSLAEQINDINSELASNYSFKDLVDETGNLGTYSLINTSLFSKKKLDVTVNDNLKVFVPNSQKETIKTNIIWDKNIINQEGDKYSLLQSVDPGTQIAQLEISKGDVKRLVPLYSSTKASIKSWKDTILTILIWLVIILIPLLLVWRIIYVRNRKRAMRRRRALKKKRQVKMQRNKKQEIIESSPIDRMAHNV